MLKLKILIEFWLTKQKIMAKNGLLILLTMLLQFKITLITQDHFITGTYGEFRNFKRLFKAPFVIYTGFGCVLVPSTDNGLDILSTAKCQGYIVCNYGCKLVCVDKRYSKPYKSHFRDDAIEKCFKWYD